MAQYELDIIDYWLIVKKRKYLIGLAALLVTKLFTFGFTEALKPIPIYEAAARVKFDRSTTVAQQLIESLSVSQGNDLSTQTEFIRSFPVMERVAQEFTLVESEPSPEVRRSAAYLHGGAQPQPANPDGTEADTSIVRTHATRTIRRKPKRWPTPACLPAWRISPKAQPTGHGVATACRRTTRELEEKLSAAEDALRNFKEREGQVFLDEEAKTALEMFSKLESDLDLVSRPKHETLRDPAAEAA
ncbi:MAG: hypothetical protein U0361_04130 [Nitrospiraceae bacterium]